MKEQLEERLSPPVHDSPLTGDSPTKTANGDNGNFSTQEPDSLEHILRSVIHKAPIVLFALDATGTFTFIEGRGLELLGSQPERIVGTSIFGIYDNIPQIIDHICHALDGEIITAVDHIGPLMFETSFMPQFDAKGQVSGVIGISTDVTKRINAEEALKTSERKFRALTEQTNDLVTSVDSEGVYNYVSPIGFIS